MSASQFEIKQSLEDLTMYPERLRKIFQSVLDSKSESLSVSISPTGTHRNEDVHYVLRFLKTHPNITTLTIQGCMTAQDALRGFNTLTTFNLCYNLLTDLEAEALADNKTLRTLNLSNNYIGNGGAEAFARNTTLMTLNLSGNRIGAAGAEALARNTTLMTLNLSGNLVYDVGAKALACNTTLTTLNLSFTNIGDRGVQVLANNTTLTALNLSSNNIGIAGARALSCNTTLASLDISNNNVGPAGTRALARSMTLRHLDIRLNNIGNTGARALAGNKTLEYIYDDQNIGLVGNMALEARRQNVCISSLMPIIPFNFDTCLEKFRESFLQHSKDLRNHSLDLHNQNITAADMSCLVDFLNAHPHITTLDISHNNIRAEGVCILANRNSTLTALDVGYNNIGIGDRLEGIQALADMDLTSLKITNNTINFEGAEILANNETIIHLDIYDNYIGQRGADALLSSSVIVKLNIKNNQLGALPIFNALQRRADIFNAQKLAFLMGTHIRLGAGTAVRKCSQSLIYDGKLLFEIFSFLKSNVEHDMPCTMVRSPVVKHEVKETQEEVKVEREQQASHTHNRRALTYLFGRAASSSTSLVRRAKCSLTHLFGSSASASSLPVKKVGLVQDGGEVKVVREQQTSDTHNRQNMTCLFGSSASSSSTSFAGNSVNNHEVKVTQEEFEVEMAREQQVDILVPQVDEAFLVGLAIRQSLQDMVVLHPTPSSTIPVVSDSVPVETPEPVETSEERRARMDDALKRRGL